MKRTKQDVITFKVDHALRETLRGISNRSQFIRQAVLAALDSACPLCGGSGVLSPQQKKHWDKFSEHHSLTTCKKCHELHVNCHHEANEATKGR